jgi:hemolysin-activating ACP:hemolysin acyltransferase
MPYNRNPEAFHAILSIRAQPGTHVDTSLIRWVDFSTGYGFYHIFKNAAGTVVGYMIWAQFNEEAVRRASASGQLPIYGHEWDEGIVNFVLDVVYRNGIYRLTRPTLLAALPDDVDKVAFVHRRRMRFCRSIAGRIVLVPPENFFGSPRP